MGSVSGRTSEHMDILCFDLQKRRNPDECTLRSHRLCETNIECSERHRVQTGGMLGPGPLWRPIEANHEWKSLHTEVSAGRLSKGFWSRAEACGTSGIHARVLTMITGHHVHHMQNKIFQLHGAHQQALIGDNFVYRRKHQTGDARP